MKRMILYIAAIILLIAGSSFAQKTLSLEECKQLAIMNNAKGKNSRLEIDAAKQISKSAFTNYFPVISAGGLAFKAQKGMMEMSTSGGNLPVYDGNPDNLSGATQYAYFPGGTTSLLKTGTFGYINVVQPIFAGGRIVNSNKLAGLGVEVKELQDKLIQNEINIKTEEQYRQIVTLDEKYKTVCKYEETLNSILNQVQDAFNSGIATKNDLLKVKLKISELLLNKSKLENGKKLAAMAFCQYIGIPFEERIYFTSPLDFSDSPKDLKTDNKEALLTRTEYNLLQKSVRAEQLQTRMKLGEYLPQAAIGLSAMYDKIDQGKERTFGLIFGTISIPISGWWGGSHELQERKIKESIAENNFKDNSELLLLQMEKSWTDFSDSYKQYLLCVQSKEQAEENLKVNNDSYKNGLTIVSDLLEAQALYQQTQDQLIESKANYLMKKSIYLQVTGR